MTEAPTLERKGSSMTSTMRRHAAAPVGRRDTQQPPRRRRGPRANPELTDRELEVLHRLVDGHTNQHIAVQLGLSPKTVMHHTGSVYRKLGVGGRVEAIAYALRAGVVA